MVAGRPIARRGGGGGTGEVGARPVVAPVRVDGTGTRT